MSEQDDADTVVLRCGKCRGVLDMCVVGQADELWKKDAPDWILRGASAEHMPVAKAREAASNWCSC